MNGLALLVINAMIDAWEESKSGMVYERLTSFFRYQHERQMIGFIFVVTCSPFSVPFVKGKPQAILEINSYGDNPFNPL